MSNSMLAIFNRISIKQRIFRKNCDSNDAGNASKHSNNLLTNKEAIIIFCLIDDYTVNDIAKYLCLSKNTIKFHIKNIKNKCHCKTQSHLGCILQSVFIKKHPQGYIQNNFQPAYLAY